jgi:GT2 family glycosyltransferase
MNNKPSPPTALPVIIPNFNRLRLLEQTLTSLFENSVLPVYPIVIDNGSSVEVQANLQELADRHLIRLYALGHKTGIGTCRNLGAAIAPPSEFLYFSDNDVYFETGWDKKMLDTLNRLPNLGILGGARHPHHGVVDILDCPAVHTVVTLSDQQAGYSMLIKRSVWNQLGPFKHTKPTEYGQEDADLCNRFRAQNYLIGSLKPPVIIHCGITRADGTDTVGKDLLQKDKVRRPGIIFE